MFDRREQRGHEPQDTGRLDGVLAAADERLKKMMIRDVDLRAEPEMSARGAAEIRPDGIRIILGNTLDGEHTVNHESIHVLKAKKLFKDKEWSALEKEAGKTWVAKYDVDQVYSDLDDAGRVEEAIAEAFADYVKNGKKPATTALQSIFAKMKRFFRAMRETLSGQGITRVEDIFDAVDSGDIGSRDSYADQDIDRKEQRPSSAVRQMSPEAQEKVAQATATADIPEESRLEAFRVKVQDRFLALRRLDEETAKATGQDAIDKRESVYFAEERYAGRTGHALTELEEQYTQPLIGLIAENLKNFSVEYTNPETGKKLKAKRSEAVSMWLYARHAKERNAHIAKINDTMPDGGSGMTEAEANAILAQGGGKQSLDRIGEIVDRLSADMVDLREKSGLMSAQEAASWRSMYKHYVPLQDFMESDMYDGTLGTGAPRTGRKFSVRGNEAQAAMGRGTLAFDPLSTLLAQAQEVVVCAEKNLVGQTMLDYVRKYNNPALYDVAKVETQRVFNKASGNVETRKVAPTGRQLAPNEMSVKVDGEEHRITFHDERLARSMGQIGVEQLNAAIQVGSAINGWFSAMYTMLSPTFVVTNAFRDLLSAEVNLGAFGGADAGKLRAAAANPKNWLAAFEGARRGLGGDYTSTDYAKWFKEFSAAGGKVHFWRIENPGDTSQDFSDRVDLEASSALTRAGKKITSTDRRTNPVLNWIETVNLSVDNAVRLSVYAKARELGWSKADAASLSKNLTVNFNRRGEWGSALNAWSLFFNASVQGGQVTLKAMKSKPVKKALGGMFVMGLTSDILGSLMSGEDDDGELFYDKISDYKQQRSLIIPDPASERGFYTVPLPYGYNVFIYAGQQSGKLLRGVKDPGEVGGDLLKTLLEAFSPISGKDAFDAALPHPLSLAREFAENRDFRDRPIRPESPYGDYGPQAYKEYNPTNFSRLIARGMNDITGGSSTTSGLIDISPEYIDHAVKSGLGGLGTFGQNVMKAAEHTVEGSLGETESYEVPILRVMHTSVSDFANQGRYYEFREAVEEARAVIKQVNAGDAADDDITNEMRDLAGLSGTLSIVEKLREKNKAKMDAVYGNDRINDAKRRKRLQPLIDERNRIYLRFNRAFIKKMRPQAE